MNNTPNTIRGLHADIVILDEYNYSEEEIVVCPSCGCEENVEEMRENMCPDCYEDYKDDFEESEEE